MNHYFQRVFVVLTTLLLFSVSCSSSKVNTINIDKPIVSIETGFTILKVRTAQKNQQSYIVASSYEGTVLGVSYEGKTLWKNKLSGFMNHDIYVRDLDNDGKDEIVTANADGSIYCLNSEGKLLWKFQKNEVPMYAVSIIQKDGNSYVVAGGFDKNIYYISSKGKLVKQINSSVFSIEKTRVRNNKEVPPTNVSTANFIRTIQKQNGEEFLVLLATNNQMNIPGTLYFFNPLEEIPFQKKSIKRDKSIKGKLRIRPLGNINIEDVNNDGHQDIVLGSSSHVNDALVTTYFIKEDTFSFQKLNKIKFGYDIAHTTIIKENGENTYLVRIGSQIHLFKLNASNNNVERLVGKYAYNDLHKDVKNNKIILASAQSGGSAIHILDIDNPNWKKDFKKLKPQGKITTIIKNTKAIRNDLQKYTKSTLENKSQPVYLMTEKVPNSLIRLKNKLFKEHQNPTFLNSLHMREVEKWDKSVLQNNKYKKSKDRRKKYTLSSKEAVNQITATYKDAPGIAYWAGHGNDPYMFQISTTKKVLDKANGKKTVLIYPELEDHSNNLDFLVEDLIYPLANYAKDKNANIFLRSKHNFWLGSNYTKPWSKLMSGEFADVFVPSMEETSDKSMELSLAGRLGMWTSGAVNSWGTRAVPDNASFDRSRQLGYQRLPNHFLRMLIFHTAYGAQFINNFAVDQEYLSIYWELIAKGALYVPKRSEIVSFSPVHVSMKEPDHHFIKEGSNVKWTTFYDEEFENNNPAAISRLNGSWAGAKVTQWDFSRYAAGVKERRLNFLAPYKNGLVLITPPQEGVFTQKNVVRKKLKDNLHPIYKNILQEYITDGRNYYSADGKQTFKADEYYKTIETAIQENANKIPITVTGDVAWVVAQVSSKHLRLTIIDNGYINPEKSTAIVTFNTVKVKKITDILNKEEFKETNASTKINIPLGGFRFIDIELKEEF